MARHAIGLEGKQARRAVILEAARRLFDAGDGSLPAVAEIATAAELAKGTVYLYFRTKEEIFVALLMSGLETALTELATTFKSARGRRAERVGAFLSTYVGHLREHPELLRLDALGYGILENNLDPAKLRAFKLDFMTVLTETGSAIDAGLRLPPGRGVSLLMRTFALTRGLWQSSHPYGEQAAMGADPLLAPLYPNFEKELTEALTEYWRGALLAA